MAVSSSEIVTQIGELTESMVQRERERERERDQNYRSEQDSIMKTRIRTEKTESTEQRNGPSRRSTRIPLLESGDQHPIPLAKYSISSVQCKWALLFYSGTIVIIVIN